MGSLTQWIEEAILRYLTAHVDAMDTAVGIAEWWLREERRDVSVAAVERVLQELTERGVLQRFGSGTEARYRLKRRHGSES